MFLLTCTGRTVDRMHIVNGSRYVFSRKVGPFWGYIILKNNFPYLLQKYRKFPIAVMLNLSRTFKST